MDTDGKNSRKLTNHPPSDDNPSWSPDGKRIAFTADRSDREWNRQIYVMDADGGNQRRLTQNPFKDWNPSWSPDGKRIAFVSNREDDGNREIFVINTNGDNPRNLTNNPDDDTNPAWSNPVLAVSPADKIFTTWGWLKQVDR